MTDEYKKIQMGKHEECEKNALWQYVTRDVVPIDRSDILPPYASSEVMSSLGPAVDKNVSPYIHVFNKPVLEHGCIVSRDIDARTERRLKQGKIPIEARIDLHGMTQTQAYDALRCFVVKCYNNQLRCILVITGKGGVRIPNRDDGEGNLRGVLRRNVPNWLNDKSMDKFVLKIHTAKPYDGGEGALYVLLRRAREN